MTLPHFEPQTDNTFKIVHPSVYHASSATLRKIDSGEIAPSEAESRLKDILRQYPWHFPAAYRLAGWYGEQGNFQQACQVRFNACQRLMELLPEEEGAEPVALNYDQKDNQYPLFLMQGSAIDHFLMSEFEIAAALLETLLELDEEDHLGVSQTLAYCYVALDEPDSFDAVFSDLDEKSAEKALAFLWAGHRFEGRADPIALAEFRQRFAVVYAEFTAGEHPATNEYLADIDGDRPSPESRARQLWLQTEHLWHQFPEFIVELKRS